MEDRTDYRIERLEAEFEKLRTEFNRNPGTTNLNLENIHKLVDSAALWMVTVILLLNLVVDFVTLPLRKALAALCIIIMMAITAKIVVALRKRKQ